MLDRTVRAGVASLAAGIAFGAGPQVATAASTAALIVVHGIPGGDIGRPNDRRLPVDVRVNGTCLLEGLMFGWIAGPVAVPAGSYRIAVSLANRARPCANAPIVLTSTTVSGGTLSAIVAALSPKNAPIAELYPVENFPIQPGTVSYLNANASNGPVTFTIADAAGDGYSLPLNPGQYEDTKDFGPSSGYIATLTPPGRKPIGPIRFRQDSQGEALLFAVGSAKSGSLTLLVKNLQFK